MNEILHRLFSPDGFMPHGHCYLWTPGLVWLHVISDALIVLAYDSIPITLLYFVRLRLVRPLARQLDGSVPVERVGRTEFKIAFPETRN